MKLGELKQSTQELTQVAKNKSGVRNHVYVTLKSGVYVTVLLYGTDHYTAS